jgi:hypothetical protein
MTKGSVLTYHDFDKKGKMTGSQTLEITNIVTSGTETKIDIHSIFMDKKGESTYESDFTYTCSGDVFKVSMESQISGQQMEAYKNMEVEVDAGDLEFPSAMEAGTTLDDAHLKMKITSEGIQVMTMDIDIVERKVETIENMTTDAGTFECFKVSSKSKTKMAFMNIEAGSIEWFAPNVGVVRSESYDKKGNLQGYRVLASLKSGK